MNERERLVSLANSSRQVSQDANAAPSRQCNALLSVAYELAIQRLDRDAGKGHLG